MNGKRRNRIFFRAIAWIVVGLLFVPVLLAQRLDDSPTKLFETYCFDCHDDASQEGGLDLIALLDSEDFNQQAEISRRTLQELATRKERLDLDEKIAAEKLELSESDVAILLDELQRVQYANAEGAATQREIDLVRQRLNQTRFAAITARERRDSIPLSRRLLETQEDSQQFALELALRNVERCRILSPINGVLELVNMEVGERFDPLARIARIVDPLRIVVPIRLPSSARASIQIGDQVLIKASGSIVRSWRG